MLFLIFNVFLLLFSGRTTEAKSSSCGDFLSCRSAILKQHLQCIERIRKSTASTCRNEHNFRQFQVLSLRKEALFSICVGREESWKKVSSLPTSVNENGNCSSAVTLNQSCSSTIEKELQVCERLLSCCSQANTCFKESSASWLTRELRKTSANLLNQAEICAHKMGKLLIDRAFAKDDVNLARAVIEKTTKLRELLDSRNGQNDFQSTLEPTISTFRTTISSLILDNVTVSPKKEQEILRERKQKFVMQIRRSPQRFFFSPMLETIEKLQKAPLNLIFNEKNLEKSLAMPPSPIWLQPLPSTLPSFPNLFTSTLQPFPTTRLPRKPFIEMIHQITSSKLTTTVSSNQNRHDTLTNPMKTSEVNRKLNSREEVKPVEQLIESTKAPPRAHLMSKRKLLKKEPVNADLNVAKIILQLFDTAKETPIERRNSFEFPKKLADPQSHQTMNLIENSVNMKLKPIVWTSEEKENLSLPKSGLEFEKPPWLSERFNSFDSHNGGSVPKLVWHKNTVSRAVSTYFKPYFQKLKSLNMSIEEVPEIRVYRKKIQSTPIEPTLIDVEVAKLQKLPKETLEPFGDGSQALPLPDLDSKPFAPRNSFDEKNFVDSDYFESPHYQTSIEFENISPEINDQTKEDSDEQRLIVTTSTTTSTTTTTTTTTRTKSTHLPPLITALYHHRKYLHIDESSELKPSTKSTISLVVDSIKSLKHLSAGKTPEVEKKAEPFLVENEIKFVRNVKNGGTKKIEKAKKFSKHWGKSIVKKGRKRTRRRGGKKAKKAKKFDQKKEALVLVSPIQSLQVENNPIKLPLFRTKIRVSALKIEKDREIQNENPDSKEALKRTKIVEKKAQTKEKIDYSPIVNGLIESEKRMRILIDPKRYPSLSPCDLYSVCLDEMHLQEDDCLPDSGRLLPGLPGRRIGECNQKMIPKYQQLDLSIRELESNFIDCLQGEIARRKEARIWNDRSSTCSSTLPSLPKLDPTCPKRLGQMKRLCEKFADCCPEVGSCRSMTDTSALATKIRQDKQKLSEEAAQCQINAARHYRNRRKRQKNLKN
ncbi:unnamed protein product, partial [Mesorhabditis belari]|uniref:Uncharacterized protein n=1 Tax=Mesorhabditis belari TaxID=2138241 RepID=A0AAF3EWW0_9BILA